MSEDRHDRAMEKEALEATLRKSVEYLRATGHPSTKYPPIYMPPKPFKEYLPSILRHIATVILIASVAWGTHELSANRVGLLTSGVAVLLVLIPLNICWLYPYEHVADLNFRGVQLINIGAFVNVVLGNGRFIVDSIDSPVNQTIGAFVGTCLITIGTIIFTFSTFILGPWEFMVGTPCLSIGLIFRSCATYVALFNQHSSVETKMNIAAIPFFVIALGFVVKKSYESMHLPILGHANFKFYGIILYGSGIICNITFSTLPGLKEDGDVVASFANVLTFWGTSIFLLDSARTKDHCDAVIEDRYPSTLYLVRHEKGLHVANITSQIGLLAAFASMTSHLLLSSSQNTALATVDFVSVELIAASLLLLCTKSMRFSLSISIKRKEREIKRVLILETISLILLAFGLASDAIWDMVQAFVDLESSILTRVSFASVTSKAITLAGGVLFVVANFPMTAAPSQIKLLDMRSWDAVFHPCNYVLLASIWLLAGTVLRFTSFNALGCAAYVWSFALLLIHWCMSKHVWESMNLTTSHDEELFSGNCYTMQNGIGGRKNRHSFNAGSATNDYDVDVFISGGGISGLFLACILGKSGLKVLIVERRASSITDARFAVLNSSSMEYMENVLDEDLLEELLSRAMPESTHYGSMLVSGIGHHNAAVWNAANSPARGVLMANLSKIDDWTESRTMGSRFSSALPVRVMQSHQEHVLKQQLRRYPSVDFRCGWLLKDFSVDEESGVTCKIMEVMEDADGIRHVDVEEGVREESVHSKFIAGCDGPGSIVAKKLQFKFDGLLNLAKTRSLLVRAPGLYEHVMKTIGNTHQYQVIRKNFGLAGIVAADPVDDLWNFLFMFGDKTQEAPVEQVVTEFLGTKDFEVVQNRSWYWNFFVARDFRRKKRAFLVGDSAHSWPPFGGIGGNSAYGDAVNLGWKLVSACKSGIELPELLLSSYSIERRQHVLQTAMYVLRATPRPELMKILISPVFKSRLLRPIIGAIWYYHNSGTHSGNHFSQSGVQLGIKLNYSPIISREEMALPDDPSCKYIPAIRAGARLPFLPLSEGTTVFSGIRSVGYTILVISRVAHKAAKSLSAALAARSFDVSIQVLPPINPLSYQGAHRIIADLLVREAILIVRPDHVIAWRTHDLGEFCEDSIDSIVSKITGVDSDKNCLEEEYAVSDDAKTMRSYHRWLTREFKYVQRPYKFMFPRAIPVMNTTKDAAIALARSKKKVADFTTSTKQGAEKIEKLEATSFHREQKSHVGDKFGDRKSKPSPIAQMLIVAKSREQCGQPVYNFAVGNPTIEPPLALRQSLNSLTRAALESEKSMGMFKYTHPAGHMPLRSYIASIVGTWQKSSLLGAEQVIVTPGAQSGLVNVFEALVSRGDRIFLHRPFYPDFRTIAEVWGCQTDMIDFVPESFELDIPSLEALAKEAGDRLRVIVLCSPSNPTGKVFDQSTMEKVGKIAKEHSRKYGRDVWIVMDHTYWRLTFGAEVPPMFPIYKNTVIVSSFSKDMSLAGERLGYVVVNPLCEKAADLTSYIVQNNTRLGNISPPSLMQHVLADVVEKHGALPTLAKDYEWRVRMLRDGLLDAGMQSCCLPDGGFYLFPQVPKGIDDCDFVGKLAEYGVLAIPGSEFGAPGYVRFAVLLSEKQIEMACGVIQSVLLELSDGLGKQDSGKRDKSETTRAEEFSNTSSSSRSIASLNPPVVVHPEHQQQEQHIDDSLSSDLETSSTTTSQSVLEIR